MTENSLSDQIRKPAKRNSPLRIFCSFEQASLIGVTQNQKGETKKVSLAPLHRGRNETPEGGKESERSHIEFDAMQISR